MKTKLALLTAVLTPFTLSAQTPGSAGGGAAAAGGVAPTTVQAPPTVPTRLPAVQFEDATLAEIVPYIQAKAKELGLDSKVNPLNVVITPGLGIENMRVPAISLRNVSPTEVLTIVTTVLGLHLEPVVGDDGQTPVAWLVKVAENQRIPVPGTGGSTGGGGDPGAGASIGAVAGAVIGGSAGNAVGSVNQPATGGGLVSAEPLALRTVEIASSSTGGGGSGIGAPPVKLVRVFGIASLVDSKEKSAEARDKAERKRLELADTLSVMSADQYGTQADIKFYNAMNLLVVKTTDPAVMTLISDAIEAIKKNEAQPTGDGGNAREAALKAEMEALKGQLKISEAEREMTRRTFTDQIEALKALQKAGR